MTTVGISDAKRRLSELVARAGRGEAILITYRDKVVARLMPLEALTPSGRASALAARIRASRAGSAARQQRLADPMAEQGAGQGDGTTLRDMVQVGRR